MSAQINVPYSMPSLIQDLVQASQANQSIKDRFKSLDDFLTRYDNLPGFKHPSLIPPSVDEPALYRQILERYAHFPIVSQAIEGTRTIEQAVKELYISKDALQRAEMAGELERITGVSLFTEFSRNKGYIKMLREDSNVIKSTAVTAAALSLGGYLSLQLAFGGWDLPQSLLLGLGLASLGVLFGLEANWKGTKNFKRQELEGVAKEIDKYIDIAYGPVGRLGPKQTSS